MCCGKSDSAITPWEITLSKLADSPAPVYSAMLHEVQRKPLDFEALQSFFGWLRTNLIRKTFEQTTQHARLPACTHLEHFFKSSFQALNHPRQNEDVATLYCDTPAINNSCTMVQLYVGLDTHVTDVY